MGKTSFLAYADERLTGFVAMTADASDVPSSNVGGSWARRIDTRREWRAFREYYQEYLPREMPPGIVVLATGPYPTITGETRLVPEFFYKEAVPPPEVLRPPPAEIAPLPPPLFEPPPSPPPSPSPPA